MFIKDNPIQNFSEDLLDRKDFVIKLSDLILNYKEPDSVSIGLMGEWGSGKTSILDLALNYLAETTKKNNPKEKYIVVKFNPWFFTNQNQLVEKFFEQLSISLKRKEFGKTLVKAGKLIEIYGEFFSLIPVYGTAISAAVTKTGKHLINFGVKKLNDLNSTKEEINSLLKKIDGKIIIAIDDVDRLNYVEICQTFQLVKLLADFPNTIYILAFDRKVIIKALKREQEGFEEEYLSKIIQVPFSVPLMSSLAIEKMLLDELSRLVKDLPEKRWNQEYWNLLYLSGFRSFFKSIRDIKRYINSLSISFNLIINEVNPVDYFAISAMQIFYFDIYLGIRDNKDLFTKVFSQHSSTGQEKKHAANDRLNKILNYENKEVPNYFKNVLEVLFPNLKSFEENIIYASSNQSEWRKELRICSPEFFDIYFRLSLSEGMISQNEIDYLISSVNKPNEFKNTLLQIYKEKKIFKFLIRLDDLSEQDIPIGNIEFIIEVMLDIGDLFPEPPPSFLSIDTTVRVGWIVKKLIKRIDNKSKRFEILKKAIEKSDESLIIIIQVIFELDCEHGRFVVKDRKVPEQERIVDEKQLDALEKLAIEKIKKWDKNNKLLKLNNLEDLPFLLYRWEEWSGRDRINKFIKKTIKKDEGLISLAKCFVFKSMAYSGYESKINYKMKIKDFSYFIDIQTIKQRIHKIIYSDNFKKLDEKERIAVEAINSSN